MNKMILYILTIVFLMPLGSCIKEEMEACPVQFTVKVFIEDKQYINISEVPQLSKKDENLPFRDFVGTIYYSLRERSTGITKIVSSFTPVMEDAKFYTIVLNDIPEGQYELTVWGNVTEDVLSGMLHRGGMEQTDLYMANASLTFSSTSQSADLMMKRAKGNLLLICNDFPATITQMEEKVSSVYQSLDPQFVYSGSTDVIKTAQIQQLNQLFLAPTVAGTNSKINLRFFNPNDPSDVNSLKLPEFDVTMSRNKISVISVDYRDENKSWEIWTYIDGEWTLIHRLNI